MPLREDLLEPIPGDNPSGADLYYDKVFDQIKEARTEDDEVTPTGVWDRAVKKADHAAVIKLAGETLAKRSKDLRLATWLAESHFKREGFPVLLPCLQLIEDIQDTFWPTLHPMPDDDGDLGRRVGAIEAYAGRMYLALRNAPVTRSGLSLLQYQESRVVGYETNATTDEQMRARNDAIEHGKVTAEDFDKSFAATPKAFYADTEQVLIDALALLEQLDRFDEEKYGDDYPSLGKLRSALEDERVLFTALLNEKRKTEPDAIAEPQVEEPQPAEMWPQPGQQGSFDPSTGSVAPQAQQPSRAVASLGALTDVNHAYSMVAAIAEYLRADDPSSPVPYLSCAGLRLGETRRQGASPPFDFAVAPSTETRQALRRLANEGNWDELMKLSLSALGDKSARAWLDLQRYIWRAARGAGYEAIAVAVVGTVRALLQDIPAIRTWMLDDDTPAANAETQQWIDTEVLPPSPPVIDQAVTPVEEPTFVDLVPMEAEQIETDIYEAALELLKQGKTREAISMLVRDSELQPSGRTRFQRRVQVAQLCLAANQDAIAYPVLMDISSEIERRGLETWESGAMLAQPLSLLLKCLDRRKNSADDREIIFGRLCRLDPQAAITSGR
jgi:type VI secretion system protein ImpA